MLLHVRASQRIITVIFLILAVCFLITYWPGPILSIPTTSPPTTTRTTRQRLFIPLPPFQFHRPENTTSLAGIDPLLNITAPLHPPDPLAPDGSPILPRVNATILSLVRDTDLPTLIKTIQSLEQSFNHIYHYPYLLLNNVPFTQEFRKQILQHTSSPVTFSVIPPDDWSLPAHISGPRLQSSFDKLTSLDAEVQYADSLSYRQMCRYYSGKFMHHPDLAKYKYYWRIDPHVDFYCNMTYDPFRYLQEREMVYGWTISVYDNPDTITSLWPTVQSFLEVNQDIKLHPKNTLGWVTDTYPNPPPHSADSSNSTSSRAARANGFSTCHFWSNFEIADLDFFRSETYTRYFEYLDREGGFFYERWGDAPVHSIALALFADRSKVHWFADIGYRHVPYWNCPNDPGRCDTGVCVPGRFTDGRGIEGEDCRANWFWWGGMQ
ncbi:glycosyltransferase family 15 protein [Peziza echinospora]|nr:glycosyltransferase family 15 protein [Peziza echinospora]